jgi:hypothetical protein
MKLSFQLAESGSFVLAMTTVAPPPVAREIVGRWDRLSLLRHLKLPSAVDSRAGQRADDARTQ